LASERGVSLDVIPFTEIRFRNDPALSIRMGELAQQDITAVITSRNGLRGMLATLPTIAGKWEIFCLGNYSKELENQNVDFSSVDVRWAGVSGASELADVVLKDNVRKVVFFCGSQRMDILPGKLAAAGVSVEELMVYDTVSSPQKVMTSYNAILFYSPSMVRSFFEANSWVAGTTAFAIGRSTAAELMQQGVENVHVPPHPDKLELLKLCIKFFS